jgi:hypothetical protein
MGGVKHLCKRLLGLLYIDPDDGSRVVLRNSNFRPPLKRPISREPFGG